MCEHLPKTNVKKRNGWKGPKGVGPFVHDQPS